MDLSLLVFFFKQKTAYEIMSGDWSSDVCSSDLFLIFSFIIFLLCNFTNYIAFSFVCILYI